MSIAVAIAAAVVVLAVSGGPSVVRIVVTAAIAVPVLYKVGVVAVSDSISTAVSTVIALPRTATTASSAWSTRSATNAIVSKPK